jgi:GNAT superfamily N-acetyltransferase
MQPIPNDLPPLPPGLRLAHVEDVSRLANICIAGFYAPPHPNGGSNTYTEFFGWSRPFHAECPEDTYDDYAGAIEWYIADPGCVVLVVEDAYLGEEGERASVDSAVLDPRGMIRKKGQGEKVIVGVAGWLVDGPGVASWASGPVSERKRQDKEGELHRQEPEEAPASPAPASRDKDPHRLQLWQEQCATPAAEYLQGKQELRFLAVHPAYQRNDHGGALVAWGTALANARRTSQGVVSGRRGEKVYLKHGFKPVRPLTVVDNRGEDLVTLKVTLLEFAPS